MTSAFDTNIIDWLDDNGWFPEDFATKEEYIKSVKDFFDIAENSKFFNAIEDELEDFYDAINEIES